jgi:hypothetical protein
MDFDPYLPNFTFNVNWDIINIQYIYMYIYMYMYILYIHRVIKSLCAPGDSRTKPFKSILNSFSKLK